jgi:hypothetical protein
MFCIRLLKGFGLRTRRSIHMVRLKESSASDETMRASATTMTSRRLSLLALIIAVLLLNQVADAQTLRNVRDRSSLLRSLSQDVPGFSSSDKVEPAIGPKNASTGLQAGTPNEEHVTGTEGNFGVQPGFAGDWIVRIVKTIGNYGESFDLNPGVGSRPGISHSANEPWIRGGVQYAPPF